MSLHPPPVSTTPSRLVSQQHKEYIVSTVICPECGEEVYNAMFVEHRYKDHNPELEREEKALITLTEEYGLSLEDITRLTAAA
jgi:hypothetical protein